MTGGEGRGEGQSAASRPSDLAVETVAENPSAPVTARYDACYPGCNHAWCEQSNRGGAGKCWQLFHRDMTSGHAIYCGKPLGHDGEHEGFAVRWFEQSKADLEVARKFLGCLRAIPNGYAEIYLNDDGTIWGTLRGLQDAVRFIGLSMNGDG